MNKGNQKRKGPGSSGKGPSPKGGTDHLLPQTLSVPGSVQSSAVDTLSSGLIPGSRHSDHGHHPHPGSASTDRSTNSPLFDRFGAGALDSQNIESEVESQTQHLITRSRGRDADQVGNLTANQRDRVMQQERWQEQHGER